jgi:transcriptional regulator with XRE-family HTH domain
MLSKLQYLFRIFFSPVSRHSFSRMKPVDRQRHIEIGKRLRQFRESARIPRTSLAIWIGIGSNQLASYESGRAALPLGVFRAIAERFTINPYWLALGEGEPTLPYAFSDSRLVVASPKARFADFFDMLLLENLTPAQLLARALIRRCLQSVDSLNKGLDQWLDAPVIHSLLPVIKEELPSVLSLVGRLQRLSSNIIPEKGLDDLSVIPKSPPVSEQSLWNKLRVRLAAATSVFGAKSALAREFHVAPSSVSEWLSGDSAPTAEAALRLLQWVEKVERKQNTGSATTLPVKKTQRTESIKHEKHHPSSRRKK